MSRSVDDRIVNMQFNNRQFESGIKESLGSLDKLKQGLDLDKAARGLSGLNEAGRNFSLAGIASGVDNISSKFSAMGIIGITALQNITNSAVNAGKRLVAAFTTDPITSGFQEYETQINAIQTIMANTQGGSTKVNQQAVNDINQSAAQSAQEIVRLNQESLANLKKTQEQKVKEHKKTAEKEIEILKDKFEKESEALSNAIREEKKALDEAHRAKIDLYHEEYMEKLRVIDEERYNQIKAIDDEIAAINQMTKAEEEQLRIEEEQKRIRELQNRIDTAKDVESRMKAEQDLIDYVKKLQRQELLRTRDAQIQGLKNNKDAINEEFDLRIEQLSQEYSLKIEEENNLYQTMSENLSEQHEEKKKNLKESHKIEQSLMVERHETEREALANQHVVSMGYLQEQQDLKLRNIEEAKKAELRALTETAKASSKAATLEDVNRALDELNLYADKTIYNFTEMTRNIGTFTAAGIDLDTSVSAIKGIANLAAVSGSSAYQASTAMYQLSQALDRGVRLQDWNSVVNAGMGGQVFQEALKETARVHGIAIDEMIMSEGSFRESLAKGWLSPEVLTDTLEKFTGDMTEEQIRAKGYTEEQVKSIVELGKMSSDAATKVKTVTQLMDTLKEGAQSGWTQSWETIIGDFEEARSLLTGISDVLGGMIGRSADARNAMLQMWKDQKGRENLIQSIENLASVMMDVVQPIKDAFRDIFPPMTGRKLALYTKNFKNFTETLKIGDETADKLKRIFSGLFAVLDIGKEAISAIAGGVKRLIEALAPGASDFLGFAANIGDSLVALDKWVKKGKVFERAIGKIAEIIEIVSEKIGVGINAIIGFFKSFGEVDLSGVESVTERIRLRFEPLGKLFGVIGTIFSGLFDFLKKLAPPLYRVVTVIGDALASFGNKIADAISSGDFEAVLDIFNTGLIGMLVLGVKKFIDSMSNVTDGFAGILEGVTGSLEAFQSSLKAGVLLKIAISIAILAASLIAISLIDPEKLTASLLAITTLFVELFAAMSGFSKIAGNGVKGMSGVAIALIGVSIAVLILAVAMNKISNLNFGQMAQGLLAIGALMAGLVAISKLMSTQSRGMIKSAVGLILFATAINILATAVERLGMIDPDKLTRGLIAVGVLIAELIIFMNVTKLDGMGLNKGLGILLLATSLVILSSAVERLSEIDPVKLTEGLKAVGIILGEIALFLKLTPNANKVISTAIGITILGAAMLIFASAVEKLGMIPINQLETGLMGMAGILGMLALSLSFMPKNMIAIGLGMIGIATALVIMSNALTTMSTMTWDEIARGLAVLAGSLLIITIAMQFMTNALSGAAALLLISASLAILANVMQTLGEMSWGEIGKSLLMLAGIFAILGLAGLVLAPLTPAIIGLAGAIVLLGIGIAAIGLGVFLFATGLTALSVAGAAAVTAIVAIVTGLIGLIPFLLEKVGEGLLILGKIILEAIPIILEIIKALFEGIIIILSELTPPLVETILMFILEMLEKILSFAPKFLDVGLKIILAFLKGIADNITEIVKAGIDVALGFLEGVRQRLPDIIDMAFKLIISFIDGLADAITKNHKQLRQSCGKLITAIVDATLSFLGEIVDVGKKLIQGLIDGIVSKANELYESVKEIVNNVVGWFKGLFDEHSPSRVTMGIGENVGEGLAIGISNSTKSIKRASEDLGNTAVDSMSEALSQVKDAIDSDMDLQPTIRPVVDMTDVKKGLKSTFGATQGINTAGTNSRVSSIAGAFYKRPSNTESVKTSQNGGDKQIHNAFNIASLVVRERDDTKRIARELYQLQLAGERG